MKSVQMFLFCICIFFGKQALAGDSFIVGVMTGSPVYGSVVGAMAHDRIQEQRSEQSTVSNSSIKPIEDPVSKLWILAAILGVPALVLCVPTYNYFRQKKS